MRNRVKAIGPVCYATVKAEGAPIVDSAETDVILERAGLLIIVYIGRGKIRRRDDWRECDTEYPVLAQWHRAGGWL